MDQVNTENNPPDLGGHEAPPNIPAKRRRGRPRKDPTQGVTRNISTQVSPQPEKLGRPKSFQLDAIEDTYNGIIGQPVTGVIESSFEAGYLLSVRIGNSSTNLRGVVFKPGHYVPISAENDVAPHVQMIRRNEITLPLVNQVGTRGRHRRSRGGNPRNMAALQLSSSIVPSMGRGNIVPVVGPPSNSANGLFPIPAPQGYPSGQYADSTSMSQGENGSFYQAAEKVGSMKQGGPSAPHVAQGDGGSDDKYSGEDYDDVDEPLDVMPLQAIHTYAHNQQPQPAHKPSEVQVQRPGKMTELLQAVQENAPGNPLLESKNWMPANDNAQA